MPAASSASLSPISWVAIDLTLTTSSAPVACTSRVTIALASSASRAQCTVPPRAVTCSSSCDQVLGEAGHGGGLDRPAGLAQLLPVGQLGDDARPAWRGSCGWRGRGCAAAGRRAAPRGRRRGTDCVAAQVPDAAGRGGSRHGPRNVGGHRAPPARSTGAGSRLPRAARISARCTVRVPARSRDRPPPMCIRQDESPAVQHLGVRCDSTLAHLVGEHRGRGVGVLHRERAAEAAALVGAGQLDQVEPADGAQQPQRPVADPQHPQRVAGRVVGDPVRVVRADVGDAEDVDQELGQLVGARGQLLGARRPARRRRPGGRRRRAGGGPRRRTSRTARRSPRRRRRPARGWRTSGTASRR